LTTNRSRAQNDSSFSLQKSIGHCWQPPLSLDDGFHYRERGFIMSIQAANDFIARANQDASVRKIARERLGDIANVGYECGFDFTADEFGQAMRERKATAQDESGACRDQTCQCEGGGENEGACRDQTCQCEGGGENEGACRDQTCQCEGGSNDDSTTCQCVEGGGSDSTTCQCVIDGNEKS
jgi:hypothetical protein